MHRTSKPNMNLSYSYLQIEGIHLREYYIIPEFSYSNTFLFAVAIYQILAIGFVYLGCYVTYAGLLLALIFQFCVFHYLCLFFCNKNYRLHFTPDGVTVWNLLNKPKQYAVCSIQWKIKRIPWYNTYFVLLYSTEKRPIAIVKPHWKNVRKILQLPHHGPLTTVEREYIKFLKSVGLMY